MANLPTPQRYPLGSLNRDYDIFEELPDGSTVWRVCVFGMDNVELKFREMARETSNSLFAVNLLDLSEPVVRPFRLPRQPESKRLLGTATRMD
jgi:hypothetical protein